ncbi:MAG: carbohydrate binding domain-containing protein [Candidatus Hodarchaeota archaeon]
MTWNEHLSRSSPFGLFFLSYRFYFWIIQFLFGGNITQLLIVEKIVFYILVFIGSFLLSKDYLSRFFNNKESNIIVIISSYIAGLVYGINPSFMIGDSFWMGIQFSFIIFPWIMLSYNKIILDKNWKFAFFCAFLLSMNESEHFLWAGFPIILILYTGFIFFMKLTKEKKVDFHPIFSFLIVILIFSGLTSYQLIYRFTTSSPYQFASTKAGVDVPWMYASIINMLRGMSHMSLPKFYFIKHTIYSSLSLLMPFTLLLPIFAFTSLLWYKKSCTILFYTIVLLLSILPFYFGSPFKWLHYWLFFNTPFGPAFRTWRISDAYIALSISVMVAFSLYKILTRLTPSRKYFSVLLTLGLVFITLLSSWPLLLGNFNDGLKPVIVPDEYFRAHSFITNKTGDFRVVYIPEFTNSYGEDSHFKPFWSPEVGAINEFLTFSSPKPSLQNTGQWSRFCRFTISPFCYSLLRTGDIDTLSRFLKWANIRYVVIHDDIPKMEQSIKNYINLLNYSTNFELVFYDNFIHIYENQLFEKKIDISSQVLMVSGGYRTVKKFETALNNSELNHHYLYLDQQIPAKVLEITENILTDKLHEQLMNDLIFAKIIHMKPDYTIYLYDYINEHDPYNKWSRASYLDPHQQVWHPYVNWKDYSWDFDYMKGLTFTINSNDSIVIHNKINKKGDYVFLLRFFANEKGGEISVNMQNKKFIIKTLNDYNGFYWYVNSINIDSDENILIIKNGKGFNAISAISLIPKKEYELLLEDATDYISLRQIKNLASNQIENPSFEGTLDHWEMDDKVIVDNTYEMLLDNSIVIDGTYSLKVITNYTKPLYGWSWIRGKWINVYEGERYSLITYIKAENVNASHIVIEAYDELNNKYYQLAQVPSAMYGTFDWKIYRSDFTIPEKVTKIRVDLNAGWSNQNGTSAITWFDNIKLIQIKSDYASINLKLNEELNQIIYSQKIDPTRYEVKVNATKPFMLSFAESYDPLWVARVNGQKISSIPLYSVINGFWIEETGIIDVTIEYEPQRWFYCGSAISFTTLIACAIYLTNDLTKNKAILKRVKKWSRSN